MPLTQRPYGVPPRRACWPASVSTSIWSGHSSSPGMTKRAPALWARARSSSAETWERRDDQRSRPGALRAEEFPDLHGLEVGEGLQGGGVAWFDDSGQRRSRHPVLVGGNRTVEGSEGVAGGNYQVAAGGAGRSEERASPRSSGTKLRMPRTAKLRTARRAKADRSSNSDGQAPEGSDPPSSGWLGGARFGWLLVCGQVLDCWWGCRSCGEGLSEGADVFEGCQGFAGAELEGFVGEGGGGSVRPPGRRGSRRGGRLGRGLGR